MEKTSKTKTKRKLISSKPTLLQLLLAVDDLCYGKTAVRMQRQNFIAKLYEAFVAQEEKQKELAYAEIENFLEKELHTAKIKRIFVEYHGNKDSLTLLLKKYNGMVSPLLAVICLSDWQVKADFKKDIIIVGQVLGILSQIYHTYECYEELRQEKKILPKYFTELQTLRDIANSLSLVGTFKLLPEVTLQLVDNPVALKTLSVAIKRFPVVEELKTLEKQYRDELTAALRDITDFLSDYTTSEQRKKALLSLPLLCNKYFEQG